MLLSLSLMTRATSVPLQILLNYHLHHHSPFRMLSSISIWSQTLGRHQIKKRHSKGWPRGKHISSSICFCRLVSSVIWKQAKAPTILVMFDFAGGLQGVLKCQKAGYYTQLKAHTFFNVCYMLGHT